MSIKGTLKADQLTLAKFSIDRMQGIPSISALAALTNSSTGETHGYVDAKAVQWSKETKRALESFMLAIEKDMAEQHLNGASTVSVSTSEPSSSGLPMPEGGLSEWVDDANHTPSI